MTRKKSGVALITVMLILSLATITAVSMVSRQNIDTHRSANILNFDQAIEITVYFENLVKKALDLHFNQLSRKSTSTTDIDNLKLILVAGRFIDEVNGGGVGADNDSFKDIQARFNLNSLVDAGGSVVPLQRTRLDTLISNLKSDNLLDPNLNFIDALIDWIDQNQAVTGVNGAEDSVYSNFSPPYRTANQYMLDISELLLVNGMDYESYIILKDYVCVLDFAAALNINTAEPQVLRSLDARITKTDAADLHSSIQSSNSNKGFSTTAAFVSDPSIASFKISTVGLDVTSNNFDLQTEVRRNDTVLLYTSRMFRSVAGTGAGSIDVVKRSRSLL